MKTIQQSILPAINQMKDFEHLLKSNYQYLVLLHVHIGQLKPIVERARAMGKKMILHVDLVDGLKSDEYATEFLAQEIQPAGIVSTRNNVVLTAKKKGLIAIQRMFLLDSMALENSYTQLKKTNPDFVEVLPGVIPPLISEILEQTKIPVLAGGLIRTKEDVQRALDAGASAITTSRKELW